MGKVVKLTRLTTITTALALLCATLGLSIGVSADDTSAALLTISPVSTPLSQKPGSSGTYNITILNSGDAGYYVDIYTQPYSVAGTNYKPVFTPLPGTTSVTSWVNLSKSRVFIPVHGTVVVPYNLSIPANTAPGGYYAVVFVETEPAPGATGIQPRSRIGDILYITAEGTVRMGGSVIATHIPHFTTAKQVPIGLEIGNSGGDHFLSTTTITVKNLFGGSVFKGQLDRYVLPQTIRSVSATWQTPPVGIFRISRAATVAGTERSLPTQWTIVIQPWVIGAIVLIVALLTGAWYIRRDRRSQIQPGE